MNKEKPSYQKPAIKELQGKEKLLFLKLLKKEQELQRCLQGILPRYAYSLSIHDCRYIPNNNGSKERLVGQVRFSVNTTLRQTDLKEAVQIIVKRGWVLHTAGDSFTTFRQTITE